MATMNRQKPYGTVHTSDASDGKAFSQGGLYFDKAGNEWVPPKSQQELDAERVAEFNAKVEARALQLLADRDAAAANAKAGKPAKGAATPADNTDANLKG